MGLESANFINKLNIANPIGPTDFISQGDDHIRLIKKTLKNTFPNFDSAVEITDADLDNLKTNITIGSDGTISLNNNTLSNILSCDDDTALEPQYYNDKRYHPINTFGNDGGITLGRNSSVLSSTTNGNAFIIASVLTDNSVQYGDGSNKKAITIFGQDVNFDIQYNKQFTHTKNGITKDMLDWIYPIGSIYKDKGPIMTNPSIKMGWPESTWERIAQKSVLIGAGLTIDINGLSQTFIIGETGGEINNRLKIEEMAKHHHTYNLIKLRLDAGGGGYDIQRYPDYGELLVQKTHTTGNDGVHNNMMPYTIVYMWVRTV